MIQGLFLTLVLEQMFFKWILSAIMNADPLSGV